MNKWPPPRNSGGIPKVSTRFSLSMEMSRLARDGTAETVSRDQILRYKRGQGNINFPCSANHEQDWQPYSVAPYSCYLCDHTYVTLITMQGFKKTNCSTIPSIVNSSHSSHIIHSIHILLVLMV